MTDADTSEAEAEAVTELLKLSRDADFGALATKADLQREIAALRSDLQREVAELRGDFQREIAESKADILKSVFGMIAGAVVINIIALAAARIPGH